MRHYGLGHYELEDHEIGGEWLKVIAITVVFAAGALFGAAAITLGMVIGL